jgi:hypothetical protein
MGADRPPITLTEDERVRLLRWAEICLGESQLHDAADRELLARLGGRVEGRWKVYCERRNVPVFPEGPD